MKKNTVILIVSSLSLIIGFTLWSVFSYSKKPLLRNVANASNTNTGAGLSYQLSSTTLLDDYHESHLTATQTAALLADIHDEAKFSTAEEYDLVGDCGSSPNVDIIKKVSTQRKVQIVNSWYPIIRTPNIQHWTKFESDAFMDDPTIVCGVGFFYPFEVTPDYILWRQTCSSGMLPTDVNGKLDESFVKCIQAQEVISREYHLRD